MIFTSSNATGMVAPARGQDDRRRLPPIAAVFRARDSTTTRVASRTCGRHRFNLGEKR
jgi:hypothetical protein